MVASTQFSEVEVVVTTLLPIAAGYLSDCIET